MIVLNESFEVFKGHCKYTVLSHNPTDYCSLNGMECDKQEKCMRINQPTTNYLKALEEEQIELKKDAKN